MRILFTGASSFTGMWFVRQLVRQGHEVFATFSQPESAYEGLRQERIKQIAHLCQPVFSCSFGSERFIELVNSSQNWDLLCHHAADVRNYKSPDFDFHAALASNTSRLPLVLDCLKARGCRKVLLTGSVFEAHEGCGSDELRAVSPYGLSKGLTFEVFLFYCQMKQFKLGKFVIPNPFGPYEELRFTTFLIKQWFEGKSAFVSAPNYVRDNVPVDLLSLAYGRFAEALTDQPGLQKINPSFYAGPQGEFTQRFAKAMETRLKISCLFTLGEQKEFPEPHIRTNTDPIDAENLDWRESIFWNELADYYQRTHG